MGLFETALSGLQAAQYVQNMIANNVANSNNPYYTRRSVNLVETLGGRFAGVQVGDVHRVVDEIYQQQFLTASFQFAQSQTFFEKINGLNQFIDNEETSVTKFIQDSLNALTSLSSTPNSISERNSYLNQLNNVIRRFNGVDSRLSSELGQTRSDINQSIDQINDTLNFISDLNKRIQSHVSSDAASKLPLLDERDKYLQELTKQIDFSYTINDIGQVDIFLKNGTPLMVDSIPSKLTLITGTVPSDIEIGIEGSSSTISVSQQFSSGRLKGLIDYNDQLKQYQHQIDVISMQINDRLNRQNRLGMDANADLGLQIFTDINDTSLLADRVTADVNNVGSATMTVTVTTANDLQASDYELSFSNATDYQLIRRSDNTVVYTGTIGGLPESIDVDGFNTTISAGAFNAGDRYIINPSNEYGTKMGLELNDGGKLALAYPVITSASTTNVGTGEVVLTDVIDTTNVAFSIPQQLNPPIRVEFLTTTTYQLVDDNTSIVIEGGLIYDPINGSDVFPTAGTYDPGYRVHLSGDIQAGDTFDMQYNTNGAGDNRNALKIIDLYDQEETYPSFVNLYQTFEFDVSFATNAAQGNLTANDIIFEQSQIRRDEVSGVSLMEEMMNMSRYQEFYLANAQVLDTIGQSMDILFSILRR